MAKGKGGVRGNQKGASSVKTQIKGKFTERGIDPEGIESVVVNEAGTAYVKLNSKAGDIYHSASTSVVSAYEMNVETWGIKGVKNVAFYKDSTYEGGNVKFNSRDVARQIRIEKGRRSLNARARRGVKTVKYI